MTRRARLAAAAASAALCLLGGLPRSAAAAIPSAARIANAAAAANRTAGRSVPLLLDVTLSIGDGPVAATGVLASHPTGLARLELDSKQGFVERHLLQGSEHSASRDGRILDSPRRFLPPVFLMQATSGAALDAALASFGIANGDVVLGRIGDTDCYALGGRLPRALELESQRIPSLWVEVETFDVVRLDGPDGTRYEFGPTQDFGGIRVPRWIEIEVPGETRVRLDIVGAAPATAPAAAFGRDWLTDFGAP